MSGLDNFLDKYSPAKNRKELEEENKQLKRELELIRKRNKRIIQDYSLCSKELQEFRNKKRGGRPGISKEIKEKVIFLANQGFNQVYIARELSISQKSVSNILRSARKYVFK